MCVLACIHACVFVCVRVHESACVQMFCYFLFCFVLVAGAIDDFNQLSVFLERLPERESELKLKKRCSTAYIQFELVAKSTVDPSWNVSNGESFSSKRRAAQHNTAERASSPAVAVAQVLCTSQRGSQSAVPHPSCTLLERSPRWGSHKLASVRAHVAFSGSRARLHTGAHCMVLQLL